MSHTFAPSPVRKAASRFPSIDQPPISILLYDSFEYPVNFFTASPSGLRIHTLASSPDASSFLFLDQARLSPELKVPCRLNLPTLLNARPSQIWTVLSLLAD